MTDRITMKQLHFAIDRLNDLFGYARQPYGEARDERGGLVANDGTFTLDAAYGGYRLCQMCKGGGERDITGRDTARATYDLIRAFTDGAAAMQKKGI